MSILHALRRPGLLIAAGGALLLPGVGAQGNGSLVFQGAQADEFAGRAVANAGDFDGDGIDDLVIGMDGHDIGAVRDAGRAVVVSGATGAILWDSAASTAFTWLDGDFFGISVDGAGDVDRDGFADIVIGAYGIDYVDLPNNIARQDSGACFVVSGGSNAIPGAPAPGATVRALRAERMPWVGNEDRLGYAVAGAGDVDGDGYDDVIVGGYTADPSGLVDQGVAIVWSPARDAVVWQFDGLAAGDYFGWSVDGAGDVDDDGFADLVVGAPGVDGASQVGLAGAAYVFSGRTGALLRTHPAPAGTEFFGASVAGLGNVDRDSGPTNSDDIAVGGIFQGPDPRGLVEVYDGQGATRLSVGGFRTLSFLGFDVAAAGDVDGDGRPDLLVSAILDDGTAALAGAVYVYDVATGNRIAGTDFLGAQTSSAHGYSIASGDFDGDGEPELAAGAPFEDGALGGEGAVRVFDLPLPAGFGARVRYPAEFAACPNVGAGGSGVGPMPKIDVRGRPAQGQILELRARGVQPGQLWVLNIAALRLAPLDLGPAGAPGCVSYVATDAFVIATGARTSLGLGPLGLGIANYTFPIVIPDVTAVLGQSIYAQYFVDSRSPQTNALGLVASDVAEITFGR